MIKVSTLFSAIDNVTTPIKNMATKASGTFGTLTKQASKTSMSITGIGAAITGAAALLGAGTIGANILGFAEAADETAKAARRLGVTTESFQEFKHWATLGGVGAEDFTKGLQKFGKQLGESKSGGNFINQLAKIDKGLASNVKNAKSNEEAFTAVIDAIDKTTDSNKKLALANLAFGKSGLNFVNAAEGGKEALEAMRKEAIATGSVISDKTARQAELFNDTIERLRKTGQGVLVGFLAPFIEKMTPLLVSLQEWLLTNQEIISSGLSAFFSAITAVLTPLGSILSKVFKLFAWLNDIFGGDFFTLLTIGVGLFYALTTAISAYTAAKELWLGVEKIATIQGGLFNAVLMACPVFWIVAAVMAIIAVGVLLYKNWDKISTWFGGMWDKLKAYFNDGVAYIKGILQPFFDWFESKKEILSLVGRIGLAVATGGGSEIIRAVSNSQSTPLLSPNSSMIESKKIEESRQTVDINVNAQGGTNVEVQKSGSAPNTKLRRGRAF